MAEMVQHWQDFELPVTIQAAQAGAIYRAMRSVRSTLNMVADHHLRLNSGGAQVPRLSLTEVEAMLSGALALTRQHPSAQAGRPSKFRRTRPRS